jgi:hypothetical protein
MTAMFRYLNCGWLHGAFIDLIVFLWIGMGIACSIGFGLQHFRLHGWLIE